MTRGLIQTQTSQQQEYLYFINSIASEATKKVYTHALQKFCDYLKVDGDCSRLLGMHQSLTEAQIIDYIVNLKNKRGLSFQCINVHLAAIFHFYQMNDVVLNRKKIKRFIGKRNVKKQEERGKAYTREQIAKMLSVADERTKAIILLLTSTGIRIGALPELKVRHFTPFEKEGLSKLSVYDGEYITFCTKEATDAINNYMQFRERCGEKIGPNSPLIREQFNREDSLRVRNPKPVTISTVEGLITQALVKTGLREIEHLTEGQSLGKARKDIPLMHGFRKFFNTSLMNSDVHPSFKKLLMGHSVELDEVYYDKGSEKSRQKLFDEYCKAIDALTINEENRLRKKVEELTVRSDQISELKYELDKLRQSIMRSSQKS